MYKLLKTAPRAVQWFAACAKAFAEIKQILHTMLVLHSLDFSHKFILHRCFGVRPWDFEDGEYPVLYESNALSPAVEILHN